jgi:hypothetical protein
MLQSRSGSVADPASVDAVRRQTHDTGKAFELKLLAPDGAIDQIRDALVLNRHGRNGGSARRLDAVYYDTRIMSCSITGCRCAYGATGVASCRPSSGPRHPGNPSCAARGRFR